MKPYILYIFCGICAQMQNGVANFSLPFAVVLWCGCLPLTVRSAGAPSKRKQGKTPKQTGSGAEMHI